jgi:hypothetical protein
MATNTGLPPASSSSFAPLAGNPNQQPQYMSHNDATIDIPLEPVQTHTSQTGLRHGSGSSVTAHDQPLGDAAVMNEKTGIFGGKGRRRALKLDSKGQPTNGPGDDEGEAKFTQMGLIYHKILNFSVITKYFIFILPLAICIAVPIVIGATVAPRASVGGVRIVWLFVWIEIGMWLKVAELGNFCS